ncbi:MAG: hypothetical protein UV74_C0012G0011 [Candidatus Woesebacteria bacterium GW2011_GWB1_43_14]|uniref:Haloacid dehalogenase n=2 Tax=Candidatus Woeseibacteriota TaxID=1752722 RepID=A0A1F7WQ22_9BACT|nr:MAG: hypothetical protein UV74_C0012G0011 [Candidatus Woesebacteria bacterium GW2011_GWB1_43_14]OGM04944.1 MAG: hypothetical protein A2112_01695 [Candidatus Woesebacteria bacterium GWA1_42_12]
MKEIQKGLITDFDNILVKTSDFVARHIFHTCDKLKIERPDGETVVDILVRRNPPFDKIFTELFGEQGPKILESYREDALETPYEATEGTVSLVGTLYKNGDRIVIVSNRTNKLQERLVQAGYNPKWFLAIIQPEVPKPDKEAYTGAIKLLHGQGVDRQYIYIIGDSIDDLEACPSDLVDNFYALTQDPKLIEMFERAGVKRTNIVDSFQNLPFLTTGNGRN